ncbi:MAG: beta-ketoacyl-ACP synthase [Calothrix sp. MO_192.B10]|nr:beta-ketoacyl-ACP synthase [Calothrix sp. MO_192.B10]
MIEVLVTGIGLVSSLGSNLEDSWQRLVAGKSGIKLHQPFPELNPLPLGLIDRQPVGLHKLTQLVVASALKDGGLTAPLPDCGVVIGSSRGYQAEWEMYTVGAGFPRPEGRREGGKELDLGNWLDTLPHMNAIAAARQIGATGIVMAPMAACATGLWAIAHAVNLIQMGQCERVIAGAVEAPITPLTIAGFQRMGALAKTGAYPFDKYREGLVLGEGGAVFVLESAELARRRQAKVYGQILGFGMTADAYHGNAPDPQGKSAIAAVKQCLQRSCLTNTDIDYIHAHGTATQLNDKLESYLIQTIFTHQVAVSSTKGATGHTLGASGALGIAFSLMALQQQILPPCVGLTTPEFDLDFAIATRSAKVEKVLCFNFGFGGQNIAIALGRVRE